MKQIIHSIAAFSVAVVIVVGSFLLTAMVFLIDLGELDE